MIVEEIIIDKIKAVGNVRQRIETKDVAELMTSIKNDGLLEPIGVTKNKDEYELIYGNRRFESCKKLGWKTIPAVIHEKTETKDIIIKNTVENIQREDVSVLEQGRIFVILKTKYNMTGSEIASRFGLAKGFVNRAINVFKTLPEELAKKVTRFETTGESKKGKISITVADLIIKKGTRLGLGKEKIQAVVRASNQDWFTIGHVETVFYFLSAGHDMEESFKLAKKYNFISIKLPLDYRELEKKMFKHGIYYKQDFLRAILIGEIKEKLTIPKWKELNAKKSKENKED